MEPLQSLNVLSVGEQTYQAIRAKILSKELSPGQPLNPDQMAGQLGVSRTPVKDALQRLEIEGLVNIVPRSGTFVSNPTPQDIIESFDLRRVLEVYAIENAVCRATENDVIKMRSYVNKLAEIAASSDLIAAYPEYLVTDHEFHRFIVSLAGSNRLCRAHEREDLHAQMARVRYRSFESELQVAQEEHERIMDAFETRDVENAKLMMDRHLERAKRSVVADMGEDYNHLTAMSSIL